MNFVEKGVRIFSSQPFLSTLEELLNCTVFNLLFFLVPDEPVASTSSNTRKRGEKNRKLPEMAPRKLAIALHAKIPWKDTRILKTVQRIRNRARSLKAIVNIVSVGLRLVTILEQVLCYTTYIYMYVLWLNCGVCIYRQNWSAISILLQLKSEFSYKLCIALKVGLQ